MLKPAQRDTYSGQWNLCLSKSSQHLNHLHECHLSLQQQQINCKVAQTLVENRVCSLFQPLSPRQSISSDLLHTSFRPGEDDPRGSSWSIAEHLWVVVYNLTKAKTRPGLSSSFHCTTGRCRSLHTVCQRLSKYDKTVLARPENHCQLHRITILVNSWCWGCDYMWRCSHSSCCTFSCVDDPTLN